MNPPHDASKEPEGKTGSTERLSPTSWVRVTAVLMALSGCAVLWLPSATSLFPTATLPFAAITFMLSAAALTVLLLKVASLPSRLETEISHRTKMEGRLATRKASLDAVFSALDDGLFVLGLDGKPVYVSGLATKLSGWTRTDLADRDLRQMLGIPTDGACPANSRSGLILPCKDGSAISVRTKTNPFLLNESVAGFVVAFRLMAEAGFDKRNLIMEAAANSGTHELVLLDATGHIRDANPAFLAASGHLVASLKEKPLSALCSPKEPPLLVSSMDLATSRGESWSGSFRHRKADGHDRSVVATLSPVRDENEVLVGFVVSVEDVSVRKQDAASLAACRAAMESLAGERARALMAVKAAAMDKGALLASMGMTLAGPAATLAKETLSPEGKGALFRLTNLASDLSTLADLERGWMRMDDAEFNPKEALSEAFGLAELMAQEAGITWTGARISAPSTVRGDRNKLVKIIVERVKSAIVASVPGGSVFVDAGMHSDSQSHMTLVLSAICNTPKADTGPAVQDVGSAVAARFAEMLDGGFENVPISGNRMEYRSTLRFSSVPLAMPHLPSCPTRLAGKRVLVAEDDFPSREAAVVMLGALGLSVDAVQDGAAAVEAVADKDYDIVLMDLRMPKLGGLEATRAIRLSPRGADLPVVALTANTYTEDKAACLAAGMNDFLTKPVAWDRLVEAIDRWVD